MDDNNTDQSDMILHDIFITFLSSILNGLISIVFLIAEILYCILLQFYYFTSVKNYIFNIVIAIISFLILPVVETLYPVFDIEKKFDLILKLNKPKHLNNFNNSINYEEYYDIELTQDVWNTYIMYLQKTDKSKFDLFDILISQKIEQINFTVTLAINRSDIIPRCITYGDFYNKLLHILGEAINIRYRRTQNKLFFSGVFGDDSPYRRFKYYDVI
jgi:hypothetical protein